MPCPSNVTPPTSPTHSNRDEFKSPTSSVSEESGVDMKYLNNMERFSLMRRSATTSFLNVPDDGNGQDTRHSSFSSVNAKLDFKTAWETVYAIQEGRKLVKPTFQGAVYNFLERPRGWKSITYHLGILIAVMACLVFSVVTSVIDDRGVYGEALYYMEIALVIFLTSEYIARLWSAGCRSKYLGCWGRLRFATKPISIIDLIIILASLSVIIFGSNGHVFATSAIRGVRFLQILRMLHMDRQGGSWRLLGSVIYMHRQELLTSLYIGFLGLVFSSYFMYLVEKDTFINGNTSDFSSYADALWWGVVTMMTIGYGDKVPHTWAGRALACVSAMFTVSFFALPAGILGSGFALRVQQQQRQKHFSRQIPAAATLIQSLWRCYAADKKFNSVATWDVYINPNKVNASNKSKPLGALRLRRPKVKSNIDQNRVAYGGAMNGRVKSSGSQTSFNAVTLDLSPSTKQSIPISRSVPDIMIAMQDPFFASKDPEKTENLVFRSPGESICDIVSDENDTEISESSRITNLTEVHKNAIRAIRKIKYFIAKRRFQQARKPYDVGDVIEQYSQGQLSMMVRIKELQRRLDQILGKPAAFSAEKSGKPATIGTKLHHLEHQVQKLDKKLDNILFLFNTLSKDLSNIQQTAKEPPK